MEQYRACQAGGSERGLRGWRGQGSKVCGKVGQVTGVLEDQPVLLSLDFIPGVIRNLWRVLSEDMITFTFEKVSGLVWGWTLR